MSENMIIYISGPMTGKKDFNRDAFMKTEELIKKECASLPFLRIINPITLSERVNESFADLSKVVSKKLTPKWIDYVRADIVGLVEATHIFFLRGWENSKGACLEFHIANKLGIHCVWNINHLKRILVAYYGVKH